MNHKHLLYILCLAALASCGSHKGTVKDDGKHIATTTKPTTGSKDKTHTATTTKAKEHPDEYRGAQWVSNASTLNKPTQGLQNRHIALWASHGRYYNVSQEQWQWQRPILYCTTEDLFTQTIVVPYLMPMLENAGATVFSPRERDWQPNEVIVDNDVKSSSSATATLSRYTETNTLANWSDGGQTGFGGNVAEKIYGTSNPFQWGTTRKAKASRTAQCSISYQPDIPEEGHYAVYVSYPTVKKNVSDAEYTVYHKGIATRFHVNQRIGSGTWVYLGTFSFDKGSSERNRVVLTNASNDKGYVTADAVRFGGGMGNISRGGQTSQLPRCLEGARYYAQWAGAPDSVYNTYNGTDDYKDDINARSRMANWLAGGSCFAPDRAGKGVPIELSLAVHSDAGYDKDFSSIYGTLSICTTASNNGLLGDGTSRQDSKTFARMLRDGMQTDLKAMLGRWAKRDLYDRNYSETRVPLMPSAIIETLSHQSFPDMQLAQDPNVKFAIARSLYKTMLKFLAKRHDKEYCVQPLAPTAPCVQFVGDATAEISWLTQNDPTEPTAKPRSFIVYTAAGNADFDNGYEVKGNKIRIKVTPDVVYRFKVTAVNAGGESFPSETLSAVYHAANAKTVLVANGFHRLSAPAVRNTDTEQGFDMQEDMGVQEGITVGWSGQQTVFDKSLHATEGFGGLGYGTSELVGQFIMGNTFDYTAEHAQAIAAAGKYNVVSCSTKAIENGSVDLNSFQIVDLLLGLERYTRQEAASYKTFSSTMQTKLTNYMDRGGRLLASGAYMSSDMTTDSERTFLQRTLHIAPGGTTTSETLNGMGTSFNIYALPNARHYAAQKVDIVSPTGSAFATLLYANGTSAAVAYDGAASRSLALGFPFECITSAKKQATLMKGFLSFLDK